MATLKQKKAAKEMVKVIEGKSNAKTAGEILENIGYSEGIVKNPKVVLKSKGYLEIFDKLIPDEFLSKKHNQLLADEKSEIQIKALDLAYKVKGSYAPEKKQSVNLNLNTEIKNSKESRDLVDEYESKLANMLKQPKSDAIQGD